MQIQQLSILLEETGLSPEDIAERIGVSGMTVRRWQLKEPTEELGSLYEEGVRKAVFELVLSGGLSSSSQSAKWAFSSAKSLTQKAALASLGFPIEATDVAQWDAERLLQAVEKLGESEENSKFVSENEAKLEVYSSLNGWGDMMKTLRTAKSSESLPRSKRSVAVGALCYLLMPFDMIPDALPLVGLLDDYTILSFAADYYRRMVDTVVA